MLDPGKRALDKGVRQPDLGDKNSLLPTRTARKTITYF